MDYCFTLSFIMNFAMFSEAKDALKAQLSLLASLACESISPQNCFASRKQNSILYIICAIITITIPYYFRIEKFIWIANTLNGLLFYWLGYIFKEKQFSNVCFVCSMFIFIMITISIPSFADIHKNTLGQGYYYIWLLYSGCGIIVMNNIAKRLNNKFPKESKYKLIIGV